MRFGILGPTQVELADGREVAVGGPRLRALLTLLLVDAGEMVGTERLIDGLYGESPPRGATNAIQSQVSRLRQLLRDQDGPDPLVEFHPAGYRLAVDPDDVDAHRFQRLAAAGQRALAAGERAARRRTAAGGARPLAGTGAGGRRGCAVRARAGGPPGGAAACRRGGPRGGGAGAGRGPLPGRRAAAVGGPASAAGAAARAADAGAVRQRPARRGARRVRGCPPDAGRRTRRRPLGRAGRGARRRAAGRPHPHRHGSGRRAAGAPGAAHQLRGPGGRGQAGSASCWARRGWSPSPALAVPARPGWPSRRPAGSRPTSVSSNWRRWPTVRTCRVAVLGALGIREAGLLPPRCRTSAALTPPAG